MKRSTTVLLALGIIVLLTALNAGFFFRQPYYEFWDLAANSLSILRAKHFGQIYGPYSRYGFYHPGAGYFYVDALGEWLFHDVLRLVPAPFNGQLLMHLCLTTGLFVAALAVFTRWLSAERRWLFVCVALVLAILHFGMTGNLPSFVEPLGGPTAFLSNWSAHFLVLPFLCLLTAGASVAAGRGRELPLLVIAGGFLVHAHVAQPLFVVPTALLAYGGLIVHAARRQRAVDARPARAGRLLTAAWRETPRAHLLAGALLAVFLLPLVLDLSQGRHSNLAGILRHLHGQTSDHKSLTRSVVYFLQFAAYAPYQPARVDFGRYDLPGLADYLRAHLFFYAGWLLAALLVLQALFDYLRAAIRGRFQVSPHPGEAAVDPADTRRFLAACAGFAALALLLTLYWGTRQEGPMYYYNSWYNFGLLYFVALTAAAVLCTQRFAPWPRARPPSAPGPPGRASLVARAAGVGAVVLTGWLFAPRMRIHDQYVKDGGLAMHQSILRATAASNALHPGAYKVLTGPVSVWSQTVAVGLQLARAGEPFAVPAGWEVVFGEDHRWEVVRRRNPQAGVCPWYVMLAGLTRAGVPADAPVFPLHPGVSLMFTPPSLALAAAGDAVEIDFAPSGHADDFILNGWSGAEPNGRWSDQPAAALCFAPRAVRGDGVEVALDLLPFVAPLARGRVFRQRLSLSFNGEPLGAERVVTAREVVRFTIPAARWNAAAAGAAPVATLEFDFPDAVSPASLDASGRNQDLRRLGFHFYNVRLRVLP